MFKDRNVPRPNPKTPLYFSLVLRLEREFSGRGGVQVTPSNFLLYLLMSHFTVLPTVLVVPLPGSLVSSLLLFSILVSFPEGLVSRSPHPRLLSPRTGFLHPFPSLA